MLFDLPQLIAIDMILNVFVSHSPWQKVLKWLVGLPESLSLLFHLLHVPSIHPVMHMITFMNIISGLPTAVQAGPYLADPWYINRMGTYTDATNHEYY